MRLVFGSDKEISDWVAQKIPYHPEYGPCATLGIEEGHQLIAGVVFHKYVGHDLEIDVAAESAKWLQTDVLRAVFSYPFLQLGCARVSATADASNKDWIRIVTGIGFRLEGTRRLGASPSEDQLIFGMLKSECRWINYGRINPESTEGAGPGESHPASNAVKH